MLFSKNVIVLTRHFGMLRIMSRDDGGTTGIIRYLGKSWDSEARHVISAKDVVRVVNEQEFITGKVDN